MLTIRDNFIHGIEINEVPFSLRAPIPLVELEKFSQLVEDLGEYIDFGRVGKKEEAQFNDWNEEARTVLLNKITPSGIAFLGYLLGSDGWISKSSMDEDLGRDIRGGIQSVSMYSKKLGLEKPYDRLATYVKVGKKMKLVLSYAIKPKLKDLFAQAFEVIDT